MSLPGYDNWKCRNPYDEADYGEHVCNCCDASEPRHEPPGRDDTTYYCLRCDESYCAAYWLSRRMSHPKAECAPPLPPCQLPEDE